MQTMREKWTDERLDDLNAKVDRGFDRVETELRAQRQEFKQDLNREISGLRAETNAGFDGLRAETNAGFDGLRTEMNARFDEMNARFDALNRTLLWFAGALLIAVVASILAS